MSLAAGQDVHYFPRKRRETNSHPCFRKWSTERLWTIAVILLVLWALGLVTAYTASGFVHVLLVLAMVVILIRVIQGRQPVLGKRSPCGSALVWF